MRLRVLDLGSGGGIDVLLSARRVGLTGRDIGLDMIDEMLALARDNAADAGATNVQFLKRTIEAIPLPADSIDVVISNCVINLSVDKPAVLAGRVHAAAGRRARDRTRAPQPLHPHSRGRQREQAAHHRDEIGPDHVRRRDDVREVIV